MCNIFNSYFKGVMELYFELFFINKFKKGASLPSRPLCKHRFSSIIIINLKNIFLCLNKKVYYGQFLNMNKYLSKPLPPPSVMLFYRFATLIPEEIFRKSLSFGGKYIHHYVGDTVPPNQGEVFL